MTWNKGLIAVRTLAVVGSILLLLGAGGGESVLLTDGGNSTYLIQGSFDVQARQDQVWDVLTDYSGLAGIVSTLQDSQVLQRQDGSVLVKQTARGRFLFFHRDIPLLLRITERPLDSISFVELSKATFKDYAGSWKLQDMGVMGVHVTYELQVSSAALAPAFIERGLFRDNALSLLKEMKQEIGRRVMAHAPQYGGDAPVVTAATQVPQSNKSRD
jgi:hypothetical protein